MKGIQVKVMNVKGNFVSYRYVSSNARTRVKKNDFEKDIEKGVLDVLNPELLEED